MRPSAWLARRAPVLPLLATLALLPACGGGPPEATSDASDASAEAAASGSDRASDDGAHDGPADDSGADDSGADDSGADVPEAGSEDAEARSPSGRTRRGFPALQARRQVSGLAQSWDVQVLPGIGLLVDERETGKLFVVRGSNRQQVSFPVDLWASGETGLMGLAVDPNFRRNRRFYACHGFAGGGRPEVRVGVWTLSEDASAATRRRVLLRGIDASSGRHGGCRLLVTRGGALLVGTGDAAVASNAQNRRSLAGKVLRLNRFTGEPWRSNPWRGATNRKRRFVLTYGHRNVQGLTQHRNGGVWSVEHGPTRDDEVNRLRTGGNYGWDPRPGYGERVPMTDFSLPGKQIGARWKSGSPTLATSGGTFVRGKKWGAYEGTLAVAALKAQRVVFMRFDRRGRLAWTRTPPVLRKTFGRLRSVTRAPNNDLLLTTANGSDDAVVRVGPRSG